MTTDRHAPEPKLAASHLRLKWKMVIIACGLVLNVLAIQHIWRGWLLWTLTGALSVAVAVVMPGRFLRWGEEKSFRPRGLACMLLLGYPVVTWLLTSRTSGDFLAVVVPLVFLLGAVTLPNKQSRLSATNKTQDADSMTLLLVGALASVSFAAFIAFAVQHFLVGEQSGEGLQGWASFLWWSNVVMVLAFGLRIGLQGVDTWRTIKESRTVRAAGSTSVKVGGSVNAQVSAGAQGNLKVYARGHPKVDVLMEEAAPARPAYPLIRCSPVWVAYEEQKVVIGLTERRSGLSSTGPVIPANETDSIDDLTVSLLLDPTSIELAEGTPRTYSLPVTQQQRFPIVEVTMTAVASADLDPQRRIGLHFMRGARSVGVAWRRVVVVDSEADRAYATLPEPPKDLLDLAALTDERPPDLVLALYRGDDRSGNAFVWDALATSDTIDVPDTQRTTALHDDAGADFAARVRRIVKNNLAPVPMFAELAGFGEEIGRVIPTGFANVLRTLAAEGSGGAAASVLLLTEESFVPWELAVLPGAPLDPAYGGSSPFLGAHVAMSRWPLVPGKPRPAPQPTHTITTQAVLSARYDGVANWPKLPEAEDEAEKLSTEYRPMHRIPPVWEEVRRCLEGNPRVDWLHVALHGQFDPQGADDGVVLLKGDPPNLTQQFLTPRQVTSFRMPYRPFVFLNACQVGAGNQELGSYAGMAVALLKAGACAVVAPQWNVDDVVAAGISSRFYAEVFADPPVPVAEALRQIRAEYTEDRVRLDPAHALPTLLAYQLLGHPRLLLRRLPVGPSLASIEALRALEEP